MTDREMLELAAKAAGFNFRWFKVKQWKNMKGIIGPYRYCTGTVDVYGSHHTKPWNPLTDDGDALRLAADLDMMLTFSLGGFAQACSHDGMFDVYYSDDRCAAMRRAITLAAAQIGKEMK